MRRAVVLAGLWAAACTAASPPRRPAPPRPALEPAVQAFKQDLTITPWELVFSGVRGAASASQFVNLKNAGEKPLEVSRISISGGDTPLFRVASERTPPFSLAPNETANLTVSFAPPAQSPLGLERAMLRVFVGAEDELGSAVDLSALVTGGEDDDEPPLATIVEALRYGVNVGGTTLVLGAGATPIGDERPAPRFVRARPTPVAAYPVARFSVAQPARFGRYVETRGQPVLHEIGVLAPGETQTLHPGFEGDAKTTFDPGDEPFGLYVKLPKSTLYTEDRRNTTVKASGRAAAAPRHAARVYPLRTRAGQAVQDAYLVAFEDGASTDYQDFVFVLYNARPIP